MNKKEKLYFISKIFQNYMNYNENPSKQYDFNFEIVHMFYYLEMISRELFEECRDLVKEGAYENKYSYICEAQKLLCNEFGIKIKY